MMPITSVRTIYGYIPIEEGASKVKINVYDKDNQFIGMCKTDAKGNFKLQTAALNSSDQKVDLCFALVNDTRVHDRKEFSFLKERTEIAQIYVTDVPVDETMDVGTVNFDNYFTTERAPLSYTFDIIKAALPNKLKSALENTKEFFDVFDLHDIKDVMESFNVDSTPLTLESSLNVLRNGICPLPPKVEGDLEIYEINLDRYSFDKDYCQPNFRLEVNKNTDEFVKLTLEWTRKEGKEVVDLNTQTYFKDSLELEKGLLGMNATIALYGQGVYHLGLRHMWGAFVAQKVLDILPGTKLGELLIPHCGLTKKITHELGGPIISGQGAVLDISGLDNKGISDLLVDVVGGKDPFASRVEEKPKEKFVFARAIAMHYKPVRGGVSEFIDASWEQMKREWEINSRFFRELHESSMPYCSVYGKDDDLTLPPRTVHKGVLRSVRLIAKNPNAPEEIDNKMIKRFCADFISSQTLEHDWIHRSQFEERVEQHVTSISDPEVFPLGIAPFAQGSSCGGMTLSDATRQIELAATFRDFQIDHYTIKNNSDVYEGIVRRIDKARDKYLKLGIDPDKIPVSIVI